MASRALLVGIDTYPDPRNNLNSCVADTLAFRQMLMNSYEFDASDIRLLHNRDATKSNVQAGLGWLLAGAHEGDRLIFFDSSHGYRYPVGDTMIEVLCLYDEFFTDKELVAATAGAPPTTLTAVCDCCHAGGLDKFFFSQGTVGVARAKVWRPTSEDEEIGRQLYAQVTKFKFFGQSATADSGAVAKNLKMNPVGVAAPKDISQGASEFNGALLAACRPDQTAAAGSAATKNLSAFTYALLEELDPSLALGDLEARIISRLGQLNMSQEPRVIVPSAHQELRLGPFIATGTSGSHGAPSSSSGDGFDLQAYLQSQFGDAFSTDVFTQNEPKKGE